MEAPKLRRFDVIKLRKYPPNLKKKKKHLTKTTSLCDRLVVPEFLDFVRGAGLQENLKKCTSKLKRLHDRMWHELYQKPKASHTNTTLQVPGEFKKKGFFFLLSRKVSYILTTLMKSKMGGERERDREQNLENPCQWWCRRHQKDHLP
jgi:hypothetical protein